MNNCNNCQRICDLLIKIEKCKMHSYCIKCLSQLKTKTIIIENCSKCKNYFKDTKPIGKNFFNKTCSICRKRKKKYFSLCPSHKICLSCVSLQSSEANLPQSCKFCSEIISNSCRICSLILTTSEKCYKNGCNLHFYCSECVSKQPEKEICIKCSEGNLKTPKTPENSLKIETSSNFSNDKKQSRENRIRRNQSLPEFNYTEIQVHQSSPSVLTQNQPILAHSSSQGVYLQSNAFNQGFNSDCQKSLPVPSTILRNSCESCFGPNELQFECSHSFCLKCIFLNFQEDLKNFFSLIERKMFNDLKNKEFCIRCPGKKYYCSLKYVLPLDLKYFLNFFIELGIRDELKELAFECCTFFEGVKFEFYECLYCRQLVGSPVGKKSSHQCKQFRLDNY